LSSFGFGTAYLGRRHGLRDGGRLLCAAFDGGITHFDTAPMYGLGLAERIVGRFLPGRRDAVTVATKVGLSAPPRVSWFLPGRLIRGSLASKRAFDVRSARASLERSLRALGTDYIDLILLHECHPGEVTGDIQAFLAECVAAGTARWTGTATSISATAAIGERWTPFPNVVQIPLEPRAALAGGALPESNGRVTITHSTVALMLQRAQQELQSNPRRMRSWSEELGVDCTRMSVWAGLALAAAHRANPHGVALFCSRSPDRISMNLQLAAELGTELRLARLSKLLEDIGVNA
jgi:D-threo-aldose 1-dehydrogenase